MERIFVLLGSLFGGLAVALGAFGAHGLRARLTADQLSTFQTGVTYQMYHALALLGVAFVLSYWGNGTLPKTAGWLFTAGILLFSGSLYLFTLTGKRGWALVTPFGGLAFIAGWVLLFVTVLSSRP